MKNLLSGLDKKTLSELPVEGFVNTKVAHLHLFKHVVHLCDLPAADLRMGRDPEKWFEIIPNPPLAPDLHARRRKAREKLAAIHSCGLNTGRAESSSPCRLCSDEAAQRAVEGAFSDLMASYLRAAREALEWARRNVSEKIPFLIAFRQNDRPDVRLKFMDNRKITGAGLLRTPGGEVVLLTCYRTDPARSFSSLRLALARERAGHRNEGPWFRYKIFDTAKGDGP